MGNACARSGASERRLRGWVADRFVTAAAFFDDRFVLNYSPLVFDASGRNFTPDKYQPERPQTPG
jgi:single-strand selective monofunctional uracil DNA glycosylase